MATSPKSLTEAIEARKLEAEERKNRPKKVRPITDHNELLLTRDDVAQILSWPELKLGIDWMRMSFPVKRRLQSGNEWWESEHRINQRWVHKTKIYSGDSYARLNVSGSTSLSGVLEFNPSTVLFGRKSLSLATLDQAFEVLHDVLLEVDYLVERPEPVERMLMSRLDIAVDIPNVQDPQGVLHTLTRFGIPPRRKMRGYFSKTNGLESVDCLTDSQGGYRAYNKSLQAKKHGSTVRFEVQANRGLLKNACPTVGDLSEDQLRHIFFDNTKDAVAGLKSVERSQLDVILSSAAETEIAIDLIGLEILKDLGYHVTLPAHRIRAQYKPFLQRYNCTSVLDLVDPDNCYLHRK